MKGIEQPTFWQFTMQSTKEAVRLYFQPVSQLAAWLHADEQAARQSAVQELPYQISPPFDSHEDLELRVARIEQKASSAEYAARLNEIQRLLNASQGPGDGDALQEAQWRLRQLETALGVEKQVQPPEARRTKGASGD